MFPYQAARVEARKKLLNRADIATFNNVPDFIVDSFFGGCTYKKRLIVSTFCYLNGFSIEQLLTLVRWNDVKKEDRNKIRSLYGYFEIPRYKEKYYSYNIHFQMVMFLNGDLRRFRERVPKSLNNGNH